jgi:hypothetical protein
MRFAGIALGVGLTLGAWAEPAEARVCSGNRTSQIATTLSVLHAGLGEWYIKDWGPVSRAPQNKFWLGFIPVYGWPYLAIRSAIDASECKTLDRAY